MNPRFSAVLIILAGMASSVTVGAQATDSAGCATARMGNRSSHAMTYDTRSHRVLLFGGHSGDPADPMPRTLWSWDGTTWRCLAADGPEGRADAFLAFDVARNRLVLFGGRQFLPDRGMRFLLDTWELDGERWTLMDSAGPGPRIHGAAAYDPVRRAVLIHGGADTTGRLRDTWEWTGSRWRELRLPLPEGAIGNALVDDGGRGLALLLGVRDSSACADAMRADVLDVRSDSLVRRTTRGPHPCFSPSTPTASTPGGLLLYAGWTPNRPAESWSLIDGRWRLADTAPPRRRGAAAVYDERRRRTVLFGGSDDRGRLGDLWEWDGVRWQRVNASAALSH
jgi:hypothetical protein